MGVITSREKNDGWEEIREKVFPIIEVAVGEVVQPCKNCAYFDKCDHILDGMWINKRTEKKRLYLLICALKVRDHLAEKKRR